MTGVIIAGRVAVPIQNKYFNENWDCTDFQFKLMENQATCSEWNERKAPIPAARYEPHRVHSFSEPGVVHLL